MTDTKILPTITHEVGRSPVYADGSKLCDVRVAVEAEVDISADMSEHSLLPTVIMLTLTYPGSYGTWHDEDDVAGRLATINIPVAALSEVAGHLALVEKMIARHLG